MCCQACFIPSLPQALVLVVCKPFMHHHPWSPRTVSVCSDDPPQLPGSALSPDSSTLLPPRSPVALEATALPEPQPSQLLLLLLLPLTLVLLAAAWGLRWQRARRRAVLRPGVSRESRADGWSGWQGMRVADGLASVRRLTLGGPQVPLTSHP